MARDTRPDISVPPAAHDPADEQLTKLSAAYVEPVGT
jgi:hypothetical protein